MPTNERNTPRGIEHPSRVDLERVAFDETDSTVSKARSHVAACELCQVAVDEMRQARRDFLEKMPAQVLLKQTGDRTRLISFSRGSSRARFARYASAAAVVMALLGGFVWRWASRDRLVEGGAGVQLKGTQDVTLRLYVSHSGGPALPYNEGGLLEAGDIVRFAVSAPEPGYIYIANIDEQGTITRYYPQRRDSSAPFSGAAALEFLDESIVLDSYHGTERVFLLWSRRSLDGEEVNTALERSFKEAKGRLDNMQRLALDAHWDVAQVKKR